METQFPSDRSHYRSEATAPAGKPRCGLGRCGRCSCSSFADRGNVCEYCGHHYDEHGTSPFRAPAGSRVGTTAPRPRQLLARAGIGAVVLALAGCGETKPTDNRLVGPEELAREMNKKHMGSFERVQIDGRLVRLTHRAMRIKSVTLVLKREAVTTQTRTTDDRGLEVTRDIPAQGELLITYVALGGAGTTTDTVPVTREEAERLERFKEVSFLLAGEKPEIETVPIAEVKRQQ
jgi:hypothetical protein